MPVLVVGAGIMGTGIAQIAAQAGHVVQLFDMRPGAAAEALRKLGTVFDDLVKRGRLGREAADATLARLSAIEALEQAQDAQLVVEAIVENLEAKRALFRQLESLLDPQAILATNTSSISVTAIAAGLQHPQRVVGMHFFNPVPLMKLVEVVSGLQTDPAVATAVFALGQAWGKVPVHTKSTPGFIVNRIARPYYAETLALLQEQAATPQVLDACLRGAGFRMGPCELMDLIGHDTNFAVTRSVYDANFQDKRFVPSLLQAELVAGGLLGRKSGRGFYHYPAGALRVDVPTPDAPVPGRMLCVLGAGAVAERLFDALRQALPGCDVAREPTHPGVGLRVDDACLLLSDGRTASQVAADTGRADVAVFDWPLAPPAAEAAALAYTVAPCAGEAWRNQVPAWLMALGFLPLPLADVPGLVVARTVAMLINEGADAALQGVCSPDDADAAMKLGVNYPAGPFEWLARWGGASAVAVLEALDHIYRGERYRVSPWLRRHGAAIPSSVPA
jgi:3-hydroxybutyryl-CoA dehydrogenase